MKSVLKTLLILILITAPAISDNWSQWMGDQRDGVWREQGIVDSFPSDGLPVKWRTSVSMGYSGPAVADGKVFVMDYKASDGEVVNLPDGPVKLSGKERVLCFSTKSGNKLWEHAYQQPYNISYPGGPRCTPTVHGDKVYTLGAEGMLHCLTADKGEVVWKVSLTDRYDTKTSIWGYTSHPLVHGDLLYTIAGGPGSICVALNKETGEEVWSALSADDQGYNAPTMITHAGKKQLLLWTPKALNSLAPTTGEVYWSLPIQPGFNMSIMSPRKLGNRLYVSAIGNASAMMELDDEQPSARILWRGRPKTSVYCSNSTPFLDEGMIYGCDVETGALMGARMKDGQRLWQTKKPTNNSQRRSRHATAFLVKHNDRYFLFNELGDLILAKLSAEGYHEVGRFHVLKPTNEAFGRPVVWSHPAFAEKSMFARNDEELVCVDLASH